MYSTIVPEFIVVPTHGGLDAFMRSVEHNSLPTIDVEAVLTLVIDALMHVDYYQQELSFILNNIAQLDDSICDCLKSDKENVPVGVLEKTISALIALTNNVFHCLNSNDIYVNNFLHYEFARIADNDSLLLRRIGR